jgi:hypothetical protein
LSPEAFKEHTKPLIERGVVTQEQADKYYSAIQEAAESTKFLEEIDSPSDFSSYTHNEFKQIVVDQLTHEFKCTLNSIVFGDPAGKEYVESLKPQP